MKKALFITTVGEVEQHFEKVVHETGCAFIPSAWPSFPFPAWKNLRHGMQRDPRSSFLSCWIWCAHLKKLEYSLRERQGHLHCIDSSCQAARMFIRIHDFGMASTSLVLPDIVQLDDNNWGPPPPALVEFWHLITTPLLAVSVYLKDFRIYVSREAVAQAPQWPDADWLPAAVVMLNKKSRKRAAAPALGKLRTYAESFDLLSEVAGLDGEPRPRARRRPRYGDDPAGPSLFRSSLEDQSLAGLRMPGLYVARCEWTKVDVHGSMLRWSVFNWNDATECNFNGCDLRDADLRGNEFRTCTFANADLRSADLRGSGFEACDFTGATLDGAVLLHEQQTELELTPTQAAVVNWSDEYEEPEGG